jgi:hypothetical protein
MTKDKRGPVPPPPRRCRLSPRDLLVLLLAVGAGFSSDLLVSSAGVSHGQAIVSGCVAFVGSFYFFDKITE